MLKLFFFCTVLYNMVSIVMTLNYGDKGVCMDDRCTTGFRFKGGSCMPCKTNQYGKLCLRKCTCEFHQRCDNVLGCVDKTTYTQTTSLQSTTCNTENFTQTTNLSEIIEESELTKPTPTEKSNDEHSYRKIVMYSVVAAIIIVILGLSYLVHKYRKKTEKETRANIVQITHSNERHSLVESIYDEIDETMLVENANINALQNEISINTDNTSYLFPIHVEDDKISSSVPAKSVNNSHLSIHESDQNHNSDESDTNDDTTSYLHPYHTINEEWKEKTHQYDITHVSNKNTDDSSDSSTQMINDGYLNPYQPLRDGWKQASHSYEVPLTVHHCQQSLTIPFQSNEEFKEMDNVDKDMSQLQIENNADKTKRKHQIRNDYIFGIRTSSKQEIAESFDITDTVLISLNKDMKEISKSSQNIRKIPKHFKNKSNSFERIETCTSASMNCERNSNVSIYTDAKSQYNVDGRT